MSEASYPTKNDSIPNMHATLHQLTPGMAATGRYPAGRPRTRRTGKRWRVRKLRLVGARVPGRIDTVRRWVAAVLDAFGFPPSRPGR